MSTGPEADDAVIIALAPAWARVMYTNVINLLGEIMAKETVEQADLDAIQAELGTIADDLEAELNSLNVPAANLSGLTAIVDRLRADVLPAPAPTPPADPTPAPADPAPTDSTQ